MHFDLLTLYYLAIGTLLLSAALTLWECHVWPARVTAMTTLSSGYFTLAMGCALATVRNQFPGFLGAALTNVTMLGGYLLILQGVAMLGGRRHDRLNLGILTICAFVWVVGGEQWQTGFWNYASAVPICVVSALTAWEMARNRNLNSLRASRVVIFVSTFHTVFYACRAVVLPILAAQLGSPAISIAAILTMYEGVLYSVGLPMALLALIREEAQAQLLEASRTDYLTGLGNRRWFFEQCSYLTATKIGAPASFSLLSFDLDHFKAINDRYGHDTGDRFLRRFAQIVQKEAGDDAILARMGGEEFVAVLPSRSTPQARLIGETVARRFAADVVFDPDGHPISATVSIGLAEAGCNGTEIHELLAAADRALYLAKARGRNRIEMAAPPTCAAA